MLKPLWYALFGAFIVYLAGGCMGTPRVTDPARTAVEQLLISTAADRALAQVEFAKLEGKKVFLDSSGLTGADTAYVNGILSVLLGKHGALIAGDRSEADMIAVINSGSFSIDRSDSFFGIPSIAIPIPLTGTFNTPEIGLFKTIKQTGVAKFVINVYEIPTGKQILAVGPVSGETFYNYHRMFFLFQYRKTDIPEKEKRRWSQP
ncbi:MAG: hypothetical protein E3K32_07815 [wastewater metagenome]|nr:hypothetical protein [Candidatus Loosdrechtia aerotolerans]